VTWYAAEALRKAFCIAVVAAQPALTLVQPVTGFQVASVHSICDLSAIAPPVCCNNIQYHIRRRMGVKQKYVLRTINYPTLRARSGWRNGSGIASSLISTLVAPPPPGRVRQCRPAAAGGRLSTGSGHAFAVSVGRMRLSTKRCAGCREPSDGASVLWSNKTPSTMAEVLYGFARWRLRAAAGSVMCVHGCLAR
jgi:hypothetical protein